MSFAVRLSREAEKNLLTLSRSDRKLFGRVLHKLESLGNNPEQGKALVGNHIGEYSLRVGDYRLVYEINKTKKTVFILTSKHRRHVY